MSCFSQAFSGKGEVFIGRYGQPLIHAGNAGPLVINHEENKTPLLNWTSSGGGAVDVLSRIAGVTGVGTFFAFSKENLARAIRGTATAVAGGSVASEDLIASILDVKLSLLKIPDTSTIVVKDVTDATTYVLGTDYTVHNLGITALSTGAITLDDVLHVSYDSVAYDNIEALTTGNLDFTMSINGINEANNDSPVNVLFHRVKFSPVPSIGLITEEYSGLEMTFDVLCDPAITTAGLSSYYRINKV